MGELVVSSEEINKLLQFKENFIVFNKHYNELQSHLGQYVAIGNGKILEYLPDRETLVKKYQNVAGLFVELITPDSIPWIL